MRRQGSVVQLVSDSIDLLLLSGRLKTLLLISDQGFYLAFVEEIDLLDHLVL